MIDWLAFLQVLLVSIVASCSVVLLFALGLRFSANAGTWQRPVGIGFFVLCGLLCAFGVYLIVPMLHP